MPRDAFGREQDEDALESMGWGSSGEVTPAPAPEPAPNPFQEQTATITPPSVPAPTPMTPTTPTATPGPVFQSTWSPPTMRVPDMTSSPRRRGGGVAALFGIVVLAAVVFAVIGIAGKTSSIHLPKIPKPDIGTPGGSSPSPPKGLEAKSLLRRGNLSPALKKIEDKVGGKPRMLRIEAGRIDMQVLAGGKLVNVQYQWDAGSPNVLSSTPMPTALPTFSWSQINASAPARLVRGTTSAGNAGNFNYAVLIQAAGLRWTAFTQSGRGYLANTKGREIKPIGG